MWAAAIGLDTVVEIFIFLMIAGGVFACMFGITWVTEKTWPETAPWMKIVRWALIVLALLVVIFFLLDLSGHPIVEFRSRVVR